MKSYGKAYRDRQRGKGRKGWVVYVTPEEKAVLDGLLQQMRYDTQQLKRLAQ